MNACPKCGGTTGYVIREPAVLTLHLQWDGEEIDSLIERTYAPTKGVKCLDCKKRVPKDALGADGHGTEGR